MIFIKRINFGSFYGILTLQLAICNINQWLYDNVFILVSSVFIHISNMVQYYGQKYVIGGHILDQEEKRKLFRKMYVRQSVRPSGRRPFERYHIQKLM